jgi:hypothetical protein
VIEDGTKRYCERNSALPVHSNCLLTILKEQKRLSLVQKRLDFFLGLYGCFEENASDLKRLYEIEDFGDEEDELLEKVVSSLDWLKESILTNGYKDSCIGLLQSIDKLCKDYGIKI